MVINSMTHIPMEEEELVGASVGASVGEEGPQPVVCDVLLPVESAQT